MVKLFLSVPRTVEVAGLPLCSRCIDLWQVNMSLHSWLGTTSTIVFSIFWPSRMIVQRKCSNGHTRIIEFNQRQDSCVPYLLGLALCISFSRFSLVAEHKIPMTDQASASTVHGSNFVARFGQRSWLSLRWRLDLAAASRCRMERSLLSY